MKKCLICSNPFEADTCNMCGEATYELIESEAVKAPKAAEPSPSAQPQKHGNRR